MKFDLSGSAVGAMKSMLQTLEKNYKIHSAVLIDIMRLPNPAAAFKKLFNIILDANDVSGDPELILKALTELLHDKKYNGYASAALNADLNLTQALKQKLGSVKNAEKFLSAVDHAQVLEPAQIYSCNYLPMEAMADQEEIFVPESGDLGLDFSVPITKPANMNIRIQRQAILRFMSSMLKRTQRCYQAMPQKPSLLMMTMKMKVKAKLLQVTN